MREGEREEKIDRLTNTQRKKERDEDKNLIK